MFAKSGISDSLPRRVEVSRRLEPLASAEASHQNPLAPRSDGGVLRPAAEDAERHVAEARAEHGRVALDVQAVPAVLVLVVAEVADHLGLVLGRKHRLRSERSKMGRNKERHNRGKAPQVIDTICAKPPLEHRMRLHMRAGGGLGGRVRELQEGGSRRVELTATANAHRGPLWCREQQAGPA